MKKLLTLTALSLALSTPAFAETIFECTTTNGKVLKLTENTDTVGYSFGKANRPELAFETPIADAVYRPYGGVGRQMETSVEVKNKDTTYTITTITDKKTGKNQSGVMVTTDTHKHSKPIWCNPKKVRVNLLKTMTDTTNIPRQ